ncbi:MAG: dihydrolipoyl dehydrogenase [Bacteriovoracia bacterium]
MKLSKILVLLALALGLALFYPNGGEAFLTLGFLKAQLDGIRELFASDPLRVSGAYFVVYVVVAALSLPGAAVLTLLGGAVFGPWLGLLLVSFASSLGALAAFLGARFLLRDVFVAKFRGAFCVIDEGLKRDGVLYLASLRLIPVFPFFLINIVLGLTKIRASRFYVVSQLAMLPGTFAYVYAGLEFANITSLSGILSPGVLAAFTLLGVTPLLAKLVLNGLRSRAVYRGHKKPKNFDYNLIAIGGGAAGLVTSYIGAAVKSKVALIERHKMGGDCLNTGCVPSKALLKTAKVVHFQKRAAEFGLKRIDVDFEFSEVMKRVQRVVREIEPHDSVERYEGLGVECISGEARILDPWTVEVNGTKLRTENIVIATGARPFVPPIPGLAQTRFVTSDTLWAIRELPKKFVILGGGPIGVEMAQAFARLGSQVTLIEAQERLLGKEDPGVSIVITASLSSDGVRVLTQHKVVEVRGSQVVCHSNNTDVLVDYDLILVALGRKANTRGFGLEELGVDLRADGTIATNEYLQTKFPNIFACGDVTGPYQLTHMAAHQAWYCAVNGLFPKKFKVDYSVVPWCTYTDPEVATVGETELSARAKGLAVEVTQFELAELDRAIAEGDTQGFVRVVTPTGSDKILGATIVGAQASSMIVEFVAAMKHKRGLNSILGTIHVYPSFGEANKYAAGAWKKAHVSPRVLGLLERYFTWKRG